MDACLNRAPALAVGVSSVAMMSISLRRFAGAVAGSIVACSLAGAAHGDSGDLSPVSLVADAAGSRLYVAEAAARQVAVFDLAGKRVQQALATFGPPTGLILSPDGLKLYVTCAGPEGVIDVFDVREARKSGMLRAGHTPMAPILSTDGKALYVCNRFKNSVSVIDTASGTVETEIPVVREPVAAALTPDGKRLLVANHLPGGAADGEYVAAAVSVVDTLTRNVADVIRLPNGSTSLRGICVSPDGKQAYVTHLLGRYQLPTTQLDRGWMNTNALSIIDVGEGRLVNTVLLDDVERGAANPWGVRCTPDGRYLCVAHAGTHEISVIDRAGLLDKLAQVAAGKKVSEVSATPADVPNDLTFVSGIRRRVKLAGNGPRDLALVGAKVYAAEYFTDSLGVINLGADARPEAVSLALGPKRTISAARKGEMLFNDATICFQQWQSCASCHPDARTDGLNWDLLNDGIGNAKNTKSLLKSHETPPAMAHGIRANAEVAVRAGIRYILFASRPEEEAKAIDVYLRALEPVPSPYLRDGRLSAAAQRGREVFASAGCAKCHAASLYTDGRTYDVGTGLGAERDRGFDTPTLVEIWRTAPYLHDGRAATMEEVLRRCNGEDRHGRTSGLSAEEVAALVEFVLSQ